MKLTKSELKKIVKEELENTICEVVPYDAPGYGETRVKQQRDEKGERLLTALMDYFNIDQKRAKELLKPIEAVERKNRIDKIMDKIKDMSADDPLERGAEIATKNSFLMYLQNRGKEFFDFHSPTAIDEVEGLFRRWHPRIK